MRTVGAAWTMHADTIASISPVTADAAYIRESILNPNAKVVKGYKHDIMPVFSGQISEEGLLQLIVYVKSLSPPTPSPAKPAASAAKRSSK